MRLRIVINGKEVSYDSHCYVIAEIGHNHQGDLAIAKEMFKVAKECGADAVKLQKRHNPSLFTKKLLETPYIGNNSYGDTYGQHREALEFGRDEYLALKDYAAQLDIAMFSTAFDFKSADFLAELDMPAFKIASGDVTNTPLLKYVAAIGKPMIVSTGGAKMEDVRRAHEVITAINPQLCLLQCTAGYPVEPEHMNLRVIETFKREFPDVVVGLSDHQNGIAMAVAAYVLGARVIEKHFTLNRAWKGTDHAFSLTPNGLRKMIRDLRRARVALGDGVKAPIPEVEGKPLYKMGKKLVAARDLPAGHVLTAEDIAIKSPGDGLPPYEYDNVIGRRLNQALAEDDNLTFDGLD